MYHLNSHEFLETRRKALADKNDRLYMIITTQNKQIFELRNRQIHD